MRPIEQDHLADASTSDDRSTPAPSRRALLAGLSTLLAFAAVPGWAQADKTPFTPEQLDQMLAPIAPAALAVVVSSSA